MHNNNPIICAIDTKDVDTALILCKELKEYVGVFKFGLEFFTLNGPDAIKTIKSLNIPIFLDLKFHDIPNTVAHAVRSAVRLGVDMLTIHTSGGIDMMQAASLASKEESEKLGITPPIILGVTILTSLDESDLLNIGMKNNVKSQVLSLAGLAIQSGLDGIVCSPLEVEDIKSKYGNKLKLIVPGIRPNAISDDQKRVMTPIQALEIGADYLVIGRPITNADNPKLAAKDILEKIQDFRIE